MAGPGDPKPLYTVAYFGLTAGGIENMGLFTEASGVTSEIEVKPFYTSDAKGKVVHHKLSGNPKYSDIELKRGIDMEKQIWDWHKLCLDKGATADTRKDLTLTMYNKEDAPILTFKLMGAWPTKYASPGFHAGQNEVGIESATIAYEYAEREQ